jgi:hypothetical protein
VFYPKLPSWSLSMGLLKFCTRHVRANAGRTVFGVLAMGSDFGGASITQALVVGDPRTEFDQLGYLTPRWSWSPLPWQAASDAGIAMLRLEGLLDWKLQAAITVCFGSGVVLQAYGGRSGRSHPGSVPFGALQPVEPFAGCWPAYSGSSVCC